MILAHPRIERNARRQLMAACEKRDEDNRIARQPLHEFLTQDEPDMDWRRGDTPTLGTPLGEILDELEWHDVDGEEA